ncbi:tetratricopeptide repeat protein [Embleya sp. NPDC020630]|uniref:serine/threonine-protein kinase n=1 Tax=Embleya sp. NPDC020630 TaxID=3363979 RepID=UPI00378EF74B
MAWGTELTDDDPRRLGSFTPLRLLGQGGMGRVYLAQGQSTRLYAVKTIRAHLAEEPGFRARFVHEARSAQRVGAAFTAPVVAVSAEDAPVPWIATAFVPAPALDVLVAHCGVLPPLAVWWLAAGIAEALESVHRAGLVHRDLKPGNVLVTLDGPRVIDFGIAKSVEDSATSHTATGQLLGTPGYMAPEHIRGGAVTHSDVFALGAVLKFAATGHPPFTGRSAWETFERTLYEDPDLRGMPDELTTLVARCLAKDPRERITSQEVLKRFETVRCGVAQAHLAASWLPDIAVKLIESSALTTAPGSPAHARQAQATLVVTVAATTEKNGAGQRTPVLGDSGDTAATRDMYAAQAAARERELGPDHPETLRARSRHAGATGDAGDAGQARELYAAGVADFTRVLGPDHPDTLHMRRAHAVWTARAGDKALACALLETLIADRARIFVPDHPDTLSTRAWHAGLLGELGDAAKARSCFADLASDCARALAPDHATTLSVAQSLGSWTGRAGDPAKARELYAELIPGVERTCGPDHPHLLVARDNLAHWTDESGDAAGARDLYAALASHRERLLGPDHGDTLGTRHRHALSTAKAGDTVRARDLFASLVRDRARVLGPDHPDTLRSRRQHARLTGLAATPPRPASSSPARPERKRDATPNQ